MPEGRENLGHSNQAETFLEWLREDVKKLSDSVDKLTAVVTALEIKIAPLLNYEQPCKAFMEHLRQHEKSQSWWTKLALELVKAAIIAAVTALLVIWKEGGFKK